MTESPYFAPATGWAGDVSPFFWDGVFHLFYLKELRDAPYDSSGELAHAPDSRLAFHHVTTSDFVTYEDHGVAIEDATIGLGTGSLIEHGGVFHFFFTGMDPTHEYPQRQLVATSTDLFTWTRDPNFSLVPPDGYERADFRDPFVFRDEERGDFVMLVASRRAGAPWHRRGFTSVARSTDLREWSFDVPLYEPDLYYMHECPDLFEMDGTWYLIFSEFSSGMQTRYRMASSPFGPFETPAVDVFDTRAFYAAKTVSDGTGRYIIGWIPTRTPEGEWLWGGQLAAWRLTRTAAGELTPVPVDGVVDMIGSPRAVELAAVSGPWHIGAGGARITHADKYAALRCASVGARWSFSAKVTARGCAGVLIGEDASFERGFEILLDAGSLVIDRFPRRGEEGVLVRQPIVDLGAEHDLTVIRDGDVVQVVSAGRGAATTRLDLPDAVTVGVFVGHGDFAMGDVEVRA